MTKVISVSEIRNIPPIILLSGILVNVALTNQVVVFQGFYFYISQKTTAF